MYARRLDSSVLVFSLSLYRPSSICILCNSHFTCYNKREYTQKKLQLCSLKNSTLTSWWIIGGYLVVSTVRLMYLRVSDSRDSSSQVHTLPVPLFLVRTCTQVHWLSQQPPSSVYICETKRSWTCYRVWHRRNIYTLSTSLSLGHDLPPFRLVWQRLQTP